MGGFLGRPVVRGPGVAGGAGLTLLGVVKSKRGTPGSRGGGCIGLVAFIDEGGV